MGGHLAQWLPLLSGFLVPILLCALFAVYLLRKARSFKCPVCQKLVPVNAIFIDEIRCPHCTWRLVPVTDQYDVALVEPQAEICHFCSKTLNGQTIQLWDGNHYCLSCVEDTAPGLAEYAKRHQQLTDSMPHTAWTVARKYFGIIGIPVITLFGIPFVLGGGAEGLLVSLMITLPIALIFTSAGAYAYSINRPSVSVRDGKLTVRRGSVWSNTADLTDYEWFVGNISQMNLLEKVIMPSGPAVLIALPRQEADHEKLVAVGFDDDTRQRWIAFLTLAKLTRRTAWEAKISGFRKLLNVVVGIACVPGCFVGCMWLGRFVTKVLNQLIGNPDIAQVIGFLVFMPGCIFAILYVVCLWPWTSLRRVPSRRSAAEQRKMRRRFIYTMLLVCTFVIAMPLMWMDQFSLPARIVGAVFVILWGWGVGSDLGKRIATLEWASTEAPE